MYISRLVGIIAAAVVFLYGIFPNSQFLAYLYSFQYDWNSVTQSIDTAVRQSDSQALASMASPDMREKYPDLKARIDAMFAYFEGEIVEISESSTFNYVDMDFSYFIETTEAKYAVDIFYTALEPESKNEEVGIRRILMRTQTDEYYSWWTVPEHYMAADNVKFSEYKISRRWCCGIGASADDYVFIIEDDHSPDSDYTNVSLAVTRNNGYGIPDTGYALRDGDELKIHFIPEGEQVPEAGQRTPDFVVREDVHPNYRKCYLKPGRYYLYIEPSDNEMYYTVSVNTLL